MRSLVSFAWSQGKGVAKKQRAGRLARLAGELKRWTLTTLFRVKDSGDPVRRAAEMHFRRPVSSLRNSRIDLRLQGEQLSAQMRPGVLGQRRLLLLSEPATATTATSGRRRRRVELRGDHRDVVVLELTPEHIDRRTRIR